MSFVSFEIAGQQTYGLWQGEGHWIQVPDSFQALYPDLKSVIAANKLDELEVSTRQGGKAVTSDMARLLPVIPNPNKIFCVGLNYKTHVACSLILHYWDLDAFGINVSRDLPQTSADI